MRPLAAALLAGLLASACGRGARDAGPAAASEPPLPSAGCAAAPAPPARGERGRLAVNGEERSWLLDAPGGAAAPLPVVLSFHGFRSTARRHRWWTGWGGLARREGFLAVHPEGHEGVALLGTTGRGWDLRAGERRDADFVRALLDRLEAERCVDRRRVYATGMSNGGFFANLLGCVLADRLAAVAPVAGAGPLRACLPARAIPVTLIHGRADRIVPPALVRSARDWWAERHGCRAPVAEGGCEVWTGCRAEVVYCEGPQGHRWPSDATARIWRFFRRHARPAAQASEAAAGARSARSRATRAS